MKESFVISCLDRIFKFQKTMYVLLILDHCFLIMQKSLTKQQRRTCISQKTGTLFEQLITGPLTGILQAVLLKEISPSDLSTIVKVLSSKSKSKKFLINKQEETFINSGDYSKFDIALLYFLLRNVCAITPHTNRWGNNPSPADRSVSANIERIRHIRNQFGHTSDFSMSDIDFYKKCKEIVDIVEQLEQYLGTSTVHRDKVQEIISESIL